MLAGGCVGVGGSEGTGVRNLRLRWRATLHLAVGAMWGAQTVQAGLACSQITGGLSSRKVMLAAKGWLGLSMSGCAVRLETAISANFQTVGSAQR